MTGRQRTASGERRAATETVTADGDGDSNSERQQGRQHWQQAATGTATPKGGKVGNGDVDSSDGNGHVERGRRELIVGWVVDTLSRRDLPSLRG